MTTTGTEKLLYYLQKNKGKTLTIANFRKVIHSSFGELLNESRIYKLTHQLKNRGYLTSLKKDILYITSPEKPLSNIELEELFYRKLLKQHCQYYCKRYRYIGELTALEIHLHGTGVTIPEEIVIFNKEKQALESVMLDKKLHFKTYESQSKNLYSPLAKHTQTIKLKGGLLPYANLELSILECLYNLTPSNKGYREGLIIKAIKKYQKTLCNEYFETILKLGKHNSSANRLYKLIKESHPELSQQIKTLIKKYGYVL